MTTINRNGFSLLELIIAIGVLSTLVGLGSFVFVGLTQNNVKSNHSSQVMTEAQSIMWALPLYLGQAINVDWTNTNINNIGGGRGRIRNFNSGLDVNSATAPTSLGVFLREASTVTNTHSMSDIRGTALYFKNPTINSPGVLTISSTGQGIGSADLSSENYVQRFHHLVEFEIRPAGFQSNSGDPVRSIQVRFVVRQFLETDQRRWTWCPQRLMGTTCNASVRYKDIEHFINIPVVNNAFETNFITETGTPRTENLFGNIYFFSPAIQREN